MLEKTKNYRYTCMFVKYMYVQWPEFDQVQNPVNFSSEKSVLNFFMHILTLSVIYLQSIEKIQRKV